jgi:L-ribulose-5-phosphate 3-epimerase UlaE
MRSSALFTVLAKRLEMAKNIGFDYVELSIDEDE